MDEKGNPPASRRYDSTARQAAAQTTRRAILDAAREMFASQGYARTSMAAIAREAGVHIDTIYESIGRKPDLVRLLLETAISGTDEAVPALQRDYVQAIRAEPDARRKLEIYAEASCKIMERMVPTYQLIREAAPAEPDLGALWTSIAERRAANMRLFVADLANAAVLDPAISREEAADIVWSTNGPEFHTLMVIERGWSTDRLADWLADAWARLLLAPGI